MGGARAATRSCGVKALVDTLKPEYGAALRRVDLDGLSVRGFAVEAGITPGNAGALPAPRPRGAAAPTGPELRDLP
jgi:hypothetical protein